MRHIGDGLGQFPESGIFYTIYHQGQQDGDRESRHQGIEAYGKGVLYNLPEAGHLEKGAEPFQSDPGAAQDTLCRGVVLKGHQYAIHGRIAENADESRCRQQKKIQAVIPFQLSAKFLSPLRSYSCSGL